MTAYGTHMDDWLTEGKKLVFVRHRKDKRLTAKQ